MKEDNCGGWTEQKRHKMGWLPAKQRPGAASMSFIFILEGESTCPAL